MEDMLSKITERNFDNVLLESNIIRMVGAEAKGCANLMRGLMAEEFKKAEKK